MNCLEEVHVPPISKPLNCHEEHCKEFLTRFDKARLLSCGRLTLSKTSKGNGISKDNDCHFMNGKGRLPVALVSTEGSGNTWTRGLLEKVTGICTGFIHCDYYMRKAGFIGENVKSSSVLVIKTHAGAPTWYGVPNPYTDGENPDYGSAIFLVRNLYDAAIAEWNRLVTNSKIIPRHLPHNESHVNRIPREFWSKLTLYVQ